MKKELKKVESARAVFERVSKALIEDKIAGNVDVTWHEIAVSLCLTDMAVYKRRMKLVKIHKNT
jgi:hypothetical protein